MKRMAKRIQQHWDRQKADIILETVVIEGNIEQQQNNDSQPFSQPLCKEMTKFRDSSIGECSSMIQFRCLLLNASSIHLKRIYPTHQQSQDSLC